MVRVNHGYRESKVTDRRGLSSETLPRGLSSAAAPSAWQQQVEILELLLQLQTATVPKFSLLITDQPVLMHVPGGVGWVGALSATEIKIRVLSAHPLLPPVLGTLCAAFWMHNSVQCTGSILTGLTTIQDRLVHPVQYKVFYGLTTSVDQCTLYCTIHKYLFWGLPTSVQTSAPWTDKYCRLQSVEAAQPSPPVLDQDQADWQCHQRAPEMQKARSTRSAFLLFFHQLC